jgi:sorting nexin-1/2
MEAKREYEHVSKLIKTEMARFEQERAEDFKDSLKIFLEGMLSRQKEVSEFSTLISPAWIELPRAIVQLIEAWASYQQTLLQRVAEDGGNTSSFSTTAATVAS